MRALRIGALIALSATFIGPAAAAETRAYHDVSPQTYECMKTIGEARHGTVYAPRYADYGTATASSFFWMLVIDYRYSPATGVLDHTIVRRSWIIPLEAVWRGIGDLIAECAAP